MGKKIVDPDTDYRPAHRYAVLSKKQYQARFFGFLAGMVYERRKKAKKHG